MATKLGEEAIGLHRRHRGKIEVRGKFAVADRHALSLAYTPGVADVCLAIKEKPELAHELTCKGNFVAVVSDGTRVLGLGDIGPLAAMPVMEGKAMLLREFGGVDAVPVCLSCKGEEEIVAAVKAIAPSFGAILLEDIESPKCFSVESRLSAMLDIPVFHDDQHGTAIVSLAGLINALKISGRLDKAKVKILVNGAGAAGVAIAKLLHAYGFSKIYVTDSKGTVCRQRTDLEDYKKELAKILPDEKSVSMKEALKGADVFIGVSAPGILKAEDVRAMAPKPVVFALCNPIPEIGESDAKSGGAFVYGSGRSDSSNQINNALCFPGMFRGLLDCRAGRVTYGMKIAAAEAIAKVAEAKGLSAEKVVPDPFDADLRNAVAKAVADAARKEKVARV
jgi:malate dehydrogenase (oxaloacetate-decarboxylating)